MRIRIRNPDFVTLFNFLSLKKDLVVPSKSLKKDVVVPSKSNKQKKLNKKIVFCWHLEGL
jgi:hypothetical protein